MKIRRSELIEIALDAIENTDEYLTGIKRGSPSEHLSWSDRFDLLKVACTVPKILANGWRDGDCGCLVGSVRLSASDWSAPTFTSPEFSVGVHFDTLLQEIIGGGREWGIVEVDASHERPGSQRISRQKLIKIALKAIDSVALLHSDRYKLLRVAATAPRIAKENWIIRDKDCGCLVGTALMRDPNFYAPRLLGAPLEAGLRTVGLEFDRLLGNAKPKADEVIEVVG